MFSKFQRIKILILDVLFPKFCLSCGQEGAFICPACSIKIPVQRNYYCYICGKRSPDGKTCRSCKTKTGSFLTGLLIASDWDNLLIRQMVYEYKYRFVKELAEPLEEVLKKFLEINQLISSQANQLTNWQANKLILIPVPLHKRRLAWRGFNQSEIIAKHLAQNFNIPLANNLISRSRHTPPQMDIGDFSERVKNISGAFKLNTIFKNDIKNKIVVLIDDVCTTGSTLEQCARVLKPLKPKEIWGLVVARG